MANSLQPIILLATLLLSIACGATGLSDSQVESGGNVNPTSETNNQTSEIIIPTPSTLPNPTSIPVPSQTVSASETPTSTAAPLPQPTPSLEKSDEECVLMLEPPAPTPSNPRGGAAPAAPNQTAVTGIMHCVWQVQASTLGIQPEMPLYIAEIEIVEAKEVDGFMNQLARSQGQTINIFSKSPIPADASGHTIEVNVMFGGDERGGRYWVIDDKLSILN